jgi:hypothetical protein
MPTVTFSALGWSNWKVPAKVTSLTVTLDGAGSGTRPGGRVTGKLAVNDSQRLYILIGGAGHLNSGATKGAAATGGGAAGGGGHFGLAGGDGGGGASYIRINSTTGTLKAVAGGAGGDSGDGGRGGSGGGLTGQGGARGTAGTDSTGQSTGGTQAQGGNGGTSSSGSQFNGKSASDTALASGGAGGEAGSSIHCHGGGGGGGGYHSGGGGQASSPNNAPGGGGAGGSSYTGGLTGAANTQGGGGTGNGSVTITYSSPPPANQPPTPPTEVKVNNVDATSGMLTKATSSVKVTGTLKDPDAGEKIRMLVRWANNSAMTGYKEAYSGFYAEKLDSEKKRIGVAVTVTASGLAQNTHYYARLYAQDQHSLYSTSYTTIDFWTNKAPVTDGLTINTQGEGMSLPTLSSATFGWHFTDEDTGDVQSGFRLQYRKSATSVVAAGAWVAVEKNTPQTSWVFDPFTFKGNTFYEWQVRTKDGQGLWGPWSDLFTFHVTSTTSPPLLLTPQTFTPVAVDKTRRFTWKFVDPDAGDKQAKADFRYRAIGRTKELSVGGITYANLDATNYAENPALETNTTQGWNSSDLTRYTVASSTVAPLSGVRSLVSTRKGVQTVVGTNRAQNPNVETNSLGWFSNDAAQWAISASTSSPIAGTRSALSVKTATVSVSAASLYLTGELAGALNGISVTPGVPITYAVSIKAQRASRRATGYVAWRTAANGALSTSPATSLTLTANVTGRLVVRVTPPAGAAFGFLVLSVDSTSGNAVTGEEVRFDNLYIGADSAGVYFDGSTAPAGGFTYRWTGTANASTSEKLGPTADTIASKVFMTKNSGAFFDATPGQPLAYGVDVKVSQNSRRARGYITWRNAAGTILSSTPNTLLTLPKGTTTRVIVSGVAPANAATGAPVIQVEATSGNALVGETVQFDRLRVGADGNYFDGSTVPAGLYTYKWLGTVNLSASQRYKNTGTAPPPTEWVTLFGATAPGIPGASQFWDIPAETFIEEYTYEWSVRTYDSVGATPSEWADSFYFYAIETPGALSGPLPFGGTTYAQGSLGCGSYRVFVYQQGGQIRLGELEPLDHMTFTRVRDDISSCNAFTSGYSTDCGAFYSTLRCWMHELVVFRDGVRVWEGPITRIGFTATSVEIEAKDVMAYAYRRILRQGYNDAYRLVQLGTGGKPNEYLGLLSAVKRASMLITQGLAPYDPNVLPYLTTIEYPDDALESRVVADWSRSVWEEVDDLAATAGIDYTTVGRRIIIWDTHRAIGRLPEMRDGDFSDSPIVTEYGMQLATFLGVTNGSGVVGTTEVAAKTKPYGPIEMLASSYSDSAAASGEVQTPEALAKMVAALTDQAKRNISGRWPAPLIVRIPDNTTLSPEANVGFQQLIPGVWLPLRSVNTPRQVVQWQKLDSVGVEYDEKGEKVHVVLSPAPNGGNDPDADAAAAAEAD